MCESFLLSLFLGAIKELFSLGGAPSMSLGFLLPGFKEGLPAELFFLSACLQCGNFCCFGAFLTGLLQSALDFLSSGGKLPAQVFGDALNVETNLFSFDREAKPSLEFHDEFLLKQTACLHFGAEKITTPKRPCGAVFSHSRIYENCVCMKVWLVCA